MRCQETVRITTPGRGVVYHGPCNRSVFQQGLCLKHFNRRMRHQIPWEDRKGYRGASMSDFLSGRHLKLRHTHTNRVFRYNLYTQRIQVLNQKINKWKDFPVDPNPELFCTKKEP